MPAQAQPRVGLSAHVRRRDLSDFGAELDMIEALGVDAIELPLYDMDVVMGARLRAPQLHALKRACAGRDVVFTSHGPLAINFLDEPFRLPLHFDVLRASLDASAEFGAIHYVLHTGMARAQQSAGLEAAYARQREYLARAGEEAKQRGLYLCVENLFGDYHGAVHTASPSKLAEELSAVRRSHVVATLDFGHAFLQQGFTGGDLVAECQALAPHARHLHLHDNFGRPDDIWMYTDGERAAYGHGDLHLPVGWGDTPWDALMSACRFPAGCLFNIELEARHWHGAAECIANVRRLALGAQIATTELRQTG